MPQPHEQCDRLAHHKWSSVRRDIAADIKRFLTKSPENIAAGDHLWTRLGALLTPQLLCLVLHRFTHWFYVKGWRWLPKQLARFNHLLFKIQISPASCLGPGAMIPHPVGVNFHGQAGEHLTIYAYGLCTTRSCLAENDLSSGPCLGQQVTIGGRAAVLGPVHVEDGVRIGHTAIVQSDIPAGRLVVARTMRAGRVIKDEKGSEE